MLGFSASNHDAPPPPPLVQITNFKKTTIIDRIVFHMVQ